MSSDDRLIRVVPGPVIPTDITGAPAPQYATGTNQQKARQLPKTTAAASAQAGGAAGVKTKPWGARNANADSRPTFAQFTAPQSIGIGVSLDDRQIAILRSTVISCCT